MGKSVAFKDASVHLKIFAFYVSINYSSCQQMMIEHFSKGIDDNALSDTSRKVREWWAGKRKPQAKQLQQINAFFRTIAQDKNLEWKDSWIEQKLSDLEHEKCLEHSYERVMEPFSLQCYFKYYYANSAPLNLFQKRYCQPLAKSSSTPPIPKYYLLYRHYTRDDSLVCDLLKIIEPDEEKMFCTFYQYTEHDDVEDPYYSQFEAMNNVRRYHGNVFFNRHCVNISCASVSNETEDGTDYVHLLFQPLSVNQSVLGLIIGLGDGTHSPVCVPFVIRRHPATELINMKETAHKFVRKISKNDEDYHSTECQTIINLLEQGIDNKNDYLSLKQK